MSKPQAKQQAKVEVVTTPPVTASTEPNEPEPNPDEVMVEIVHGRVGSVGPGSVIFLSKDDARNCIAAGVAKRVE